MAGSLLLTSVQISLQFPSLKFLPGFTTLRWHLDGSMWNAYDNLFVIFDNGLSTILRLVMHASLFSISPPLIFHFEQGHFTLAQNIESSTILQALKCFSF